MVKLITTNSQFHIFNLLASSIEGANDLNEKKVVFCEEKISLMTERIIASCFGGSFSIDVCSFGNYLRARVKNSKVLSKEGASMALRATLLDCPLKSLSKSKQNLAPSLYDLIIQLKSASVTPKELKEAGLSIDGTLGEKLVDLAEVYARYEQFLLDSGYVDQSGMLSALPQIIDSSSELENADVYIVGYAGFTAQIRKIITSLLKKARSVTAILTEGENPYAFVNETANAFRALVKKENLALEEKFIPSPYEKEGEIIEKNLFSPYLYSAKKEQTQKIKLIKCQNAYDELEKVASIIKEKVISGEIRYKDVTIALPNAEEYREKIYSAFSALEVPYFLDEKKVALSHPLVKLICAYIDAFRKNFEKDTLKAFYCNPYFNGDKALSDDFYNYILRYGINYSAIKKPFSLPTKTNRKLEELEAFRQKITSFTKEFNLSDLLKRLDVKTTCVSLAKSLGSLGEHEEGAISMQIYSAVINVLNEIDRILPTAKSNLLEFKRVFLSGVSAIEMSIIPQYNDAVFIGGYREASLAKAKFIFAVGLNYDVPSIQEDGALLSDSDIEGLEKLKVLVEPKIKIVNHRSRESLVLALAGFSDGLYLSCPLLNDKNAENKESDILTNIKEQLFAVNEQSVDNKFITERQGVITFATECGKDLANTLDDFISPSSFYKTQLNGKFSKEVESILSRANKEVKFKLNKNKQILLSSVKAPTGIENYQTCPYSAFLKLALKIREREEGGVNAIAVGNFMHNIFEQYLARINEVTDEKSSKKLFDEIKDGVLNRSEFSAMSEGAENREITKNALLECEKYCYKSFEWKNAGKFTTKKDDLEVKFGKDGKYPAIKLLNGEVELSGKIDRVDTCDEYFRIIDYKTGRDKFLEEDFFAGKKLQLFLYANAVSGEKDDQKRKLAGAYYFKIDDKYIQSGKEKPPVAVGKTRGDIKVLELQDENLSKNGSSEFIPAYIDGKNNIKETLTEEQMTAYLDYAKLVCEKSALNMKEGVIVASPLEKACEYCQFFGMCDNEHKLTRKIKKVTDQTILSSVENKEDIE